MGHDNQAKILLQMAYNVLKTQEQKNYIIDIMAQPVEYNNCIISVRELLRMIEKYMEE